LSIKTSDEYVEDHGRECPVCGSDRVWKHFIEAEDHEDFIDVEASCHNCGSVWEIHYGLRGMTILTERREDKIIRYGAHPKC
jgi:uncharacterized Zn finger protein